MYHSVYTVIYYDIIISIHALIHDDTWYDYRIYWRQRFQVMKFLRKLWKWVQWPTPLVPYPNATTGHVSATSCKPNIPLPSPQRYGVPVHHGKISLLLFDPLCSHCMHVGCMSMLFDPLCSYCMHVGCMSKLYMTHTPILKAFCNYCINLHVFIDHRTLDFFSKRGTQLTSVFVVILGRV